jgi:hypothetical protein
LIDPIGRLLLVRIGDVQVGIDQRSERSQQVACSSKAS